MVLGRRVTGAALTAAGLCARRDAGLTPAVKLWVRLEEGDLALSCTGEWESPIFLFP
jgi:hypothetical protein